MKLVLVQALRAFAALIVVMHHAQPEGTAIAAATGLAFTPSRLLPWAAGVDVFFVISGFIIVHASGPLYGQPGGRRRFLAHRVARLVPLYWLVSAAYLAIALAVPSALSGLIGGERLDPAYVAASFLFWPMTRADGVPVPLYGLGWTLNCEMFFYLLFALGLGWGRRAAVAWLVASLTALALLRLAVPDLPMPLAFWTSPLILEFALGAALGLARAEGFGLGGWTRLGLGLAGLMMLALVPEPDLALHPVYYGIPATLLVAAAALVKDASPLSRAGEGQGEGPDLSGEGVSLTPTLSLHGRGGPSGPSSTIARLLVAPAVALGDASYALYLIHPFVLRAAREAILRSGLGPLLGPWGGVAVMVALAALAALAVYRLVERPLTRRARALLDPHPPDTAGKSLDGAAGHVSRSVKRR